MALGVSWRGVASVNDGCSSDHGPADVEVVTAASWVPGTPLASDQMASEYELATEDELLSLVLRNRMSTDTTSTVVAGAVNDWASQFCPCTDRQAPSVICSNSEMVDARDSWRPRTPTIASTIRTATSGLRLVRCRVACLDFTR